MPEKTVLPISRTALAALLFKLERGGAQDVEEARDTIIDLCGEAVHSPPDLTWLQPTPDESAEAFDDEPLQLRLRYA